MHRACLHFRAEALSSSLNRKSPSLLQARGLDVVPQTIARFRSGGDPETADLLEKTIYPVCLLCTIPVLHKFPNRCTFAHLIHLLGDSKRSSQVRAAWFKVWFDRAS